MQRTAFEPVRRASRNHRLTAFELDALVEARLAGAEIAELAVRFQVGRSTVLEHLKRQGVPGRRRPGRMLGSEELIGAGKLYESGMRLELVAERFGVDRRYLRRELSAAGFAIRPGGRQQRS